MGLVPPAALVAFALGSILFGWATPTEGAACGAFGALLLTILYGRFSLDGLYQALLKTLEISVLILFLVAASNFFGAVFSTARYTNLVNRVFTILGYVYNDGTYYHNGDGLSARLAFGMGADCFNYFAYLDTCPD